MSKKYLAHFVMMKKRSGKATDLDQCFVLPSGLVTGRIFGS